MKRLPWLLLLLAAAPLARAATPTLVVRAETLHTLEGPAVRDGIVVVREGKIAYAGPAAGQALPADARVVQARVVTPGLIDARATAGLSGALNQTQDQDMLERSAPIQPELRAIDAYNARDPLVAWVRSFGISTMNTGHAPGTLVSGQTMIIKTAGRSVESDVVNPAAMIAVALGNSGVMRAEGAAPAKAPGTRAKAVALLRAELIKAQDYGKKRGLADESKRPGRDLRLEALLRGLDGSQRFLVTVQRQQDILAALRLAREFNLQLVLDGCADAHLVLDEIKASGFPVVLHPTMARANEDMENLAMDTAVRLAEAGILFALQSGYESYVPKTRVVLFEAAVAAGRGLGFERALASVTRDAARILGIADRTGSLAVGKDADLALFDGDPFEYTAHVTGTVIDGVLFTDGPR